MNLLLQILVHFFVLQFCQGGTRRKWENTAVTFVGGKGQSRKLFLALDRKDHFRAVHSFCPPPYCIFTINFKKWIKKKLKVRFSANLVRLVEPLMSGELKICWGDENVFRMYPKPPLVDCHRIAYLNVTEKAMPEPLTLDFYTWFMDEDHHRHLRMTPTQYTEITVPLMQKGAYKLPISLLIFHQAPRNRLRCSFKINKKIKKVDIGRRGRTVRHNSKHLTRVDFYLKSNTTKVNSVVAHCKSLYYYPPDQKWFPMNVFKRVLIKFKKFPLIDLKGNPQNIIYLPYYNKTSHFFIDIYTISYVATVSIARSDGVRRKKRSELIPQFLGQEFYQLRAKYKINIPYIDSGITGKYTISIVNKHGQKASLKFRIQRLKEIIAFVSPKWVEAEEGTTVILYCLVITDLPKRTVVKWKTGSPERLPYAKVLEVTGDRKAVELTLPSVQLTHSGVYSCSAYSGFQEALEGVILQVYPRGDPEHRTQTKATWFDKLKCDQVVDTQILKNMKIAGQIGIGLVVLFAICALATIIAWKVYTIVKAKGWLEPSEEEPQTITTTTTEPEEDKEEEEEEEEGEEEEEEQEEEEEEDEDDEEDEDTDGDTDETQKLLENLDNVESTEESPKKKHKKKHKGKRK